MRKFIFVLFVFTAFCSCKKEYDNTNSKEESTTQSSNNLQSESQSIDPNYFSSQGGFWDISESKLFGGVVGDTVRFSWPSLYNINEATVTVQCNGEMIDTTFTYGDSAVYFRLKFKNSGESTQSNRTIDFDLDPSKANCQHLGITKIVTNISFNGNWSYDISTNELTWTQIITDVEVNPGEPLVSQTNGTVTFVSDDEFILNGSVQFINSTPSQYFIEYRFKRKTGSE